MSNLVTSISLCSKCNNTFNISESHTYPPVSINDFRSNVVPSAEDRVRISEIIADEERELARYSQDIIRLRRIVDQLELERSTLQTRITHRRSFISSRRRLPSELWSDIFDLACGTEEYSLIIGPNSSVRVALPSVFSQVSIQWRGIMGSLPHLWSSISIDFTWLKPGINVLLEQYLQNAADFPLTVQMRYNGPYDHQYMPLNSLAALQLLFRNIARCKALDIVNLHDAKVMTRAPVPSTTVSFPLMQSIKMYSTSYEENPRFWDNVRTAPRLTHAAIIGLSLVRFLPLERLVSLDIETVTHSEPILDVLRGCSSLQTLNMTGLGHHSLNIGPAGQIVRMPSLRCLSLDFWWYTDNLEELLKALALPSLNSLKLLNTYRVEQNAVFRVVPLLSFSQSLTKVSLNLGRLRLPRGSMVQIFRALSYLTDFEICYSGETDSESVVGVTHELLLVLGADSSIAPRLGSLRLREHKSPFRVELVEAAIALLEGQDRPLKYIQLYFKGDGQQLPAELLARMRNLKERGMECITEFLGPDVN
ncbi:hypothetical protein Moror_16383 [Moniliophthora roreri MCA 2997]|uniref:F-box domain-containing protein n=2 Tax=Moniliophthora roreri TaxID=221103 RepID=V2XEP2_MONRO|nr:hypothetical protein Moror_16383 [Moniliophthora roreri MCA 2997]